jgi:hypothetical protein
VQNDDQCYAIEYTYVTKSDSNQIKEIPYQPDSRFLTISSTKQTTKTKEMFIDHYDGLVLSSNTANTYQLLNDIINDFYLSYSIKYNLKSFEFLIKYFNSILTCCKQTFSLNLKINVILMVSSFHSF